MEPILNFCRQEIVAYTEEEARAQAPFFVIKNVTRSYKKWRSKQRGEVTNHMILSFFADFLYTNTRATPGLGFIITVEGSKAGRKARPYVIDIEEKEEGRTKYKRVYQLVDDNNRILDEINGDKKEAMLRAKELVSLSTKTNITCRRVKVAIAPNDVAFKVNYYAGKHSRKGIYIVFGIKNIQ